VFPFELLCLDWFIIAQQREMLNVFSSIVFCGFTIFCHLSFHHDIFFGLPFFLDCHQVALVDSDLFLEFMARKSTSLSCV